MTKTKSLGLQIRWNCRSFCVIVVDRIIDWLRTSQPTREKKLKSQIPGAYVLLNKATK